MKPIEFYTTPEGEVTMRPLGEAERQLRESDTEFIQAFLEILREFYTEAYTVEKPLNFDPFGHARFAHLFVLYD